MVINKYAGIYFRYLNLNVHEIVTVTNKIVVLYVYKQL